MLQIEYIQDGYGNNCSVSSSLLKEKLKSFLHLTPKDHLTDERCLGSIGILSHNSCGIDWEGCTLLTVYFAHWLCGHKIQDAIGKDKTGKLGIKCLRRAGLILFDEYRNEIVLDEKQCLLFLQDLSEKWKGGQ